MKERSEGFLLIEVLVALSLVTMSGPAAVLAAHAIAQASSTAHHQLHAELDAEQRLADRRYQLFERGVSAGDSPQALPCRGPMSIPATSGALAVEPCLLHLEPARGRAVVRVVPLFGE